MSGSSIRRGPADNLDFVLHDAMRLVEQLRRKGRTVMIHCVAAESRTPTIATLYGARPRDIRIDDALAGVCGLSPAADAIDRLIPVQLVHDDVTSDGAAGPLPALNLDLDVVAVIAS